MKKNMALLAVMATLTLGSCSRFSSQPPTPWESVENIYKDSVAYDGYCLPGSTSKTLRMVTPNNDTLTLDLTAVASKKKIFGDIQAGDELYVMMSADSTTVQMVVNKSSLLGKWVQPDPIDGSSDIGIEIKIGGDAKSYSYPEGTSYVEYISWRLHNGKMVIEELRDDGLGETEQRTYEIIKVTPDSLILRADDDIEAPYDYGRWKPNHDYDDLPAGLEIDDGLADEIIW